MHQRARFEPVPAAHKRLPVQDLHRSRSTACSFATSTSARSTSRNRSALRRRTTRMGVNLGRRSVVVMGLRIGAGVRGLVERPPGTNASNPPAPQGPDPTVDAVAAHPYRHPIGSGMLSPARERTARPRSAWLSARSAASRIRV